MGKIEECACLRAQLRQAAVAVSRYSATPAAWMIEIEFYGPDGLQDLRCLTSAEEVESVIAHWCPACQRLDGHHFRANHGGKVPQKPKE
jgi:hypothetical protein